MGPSPTWGRDQPGSTRFHGLDVATQHALRSPFKKQPRLLLEFSDTFLDYAGLNCLNLLNA